jgi:hypothetical protein
MIPAVQYMIRVKQFAIANGLKFFTWADMKIAIAAYKEYQSFKN